MAVVGKRGARGLAGGILTRSLPIFVHGGSLLPGDLP